MEPIGRYASDIVVGQLCAIISDHMAAFGGEKGVKPSDPRSFVWYLSEDARKRKLKSEPIVDMDFMKHMFGKT